MTSPDRPEQCERRIQEHLVLGPLPPAAAVQITVDGQPILARAGESVAAAFLAAGIRIYRTMPQSGEHRGGFCFVGRCADCMMVVDGEPNVRTCLTPVRDGMWVETQHGYGQLNWPGGETR